MKVVILAGGKGTRISAYTKSIPKPMIEVGKKPIIVHIMQHYVKFGFKDFIVAAGYKQEVIKKYFKNNTFGWNIKIIDTGKHSMTGGRLKRVEKYLKKEENFMFTYGDGISNVNLKKLLKFHLLKKKLVTVTAVRPPARFGEIVLNKNFVKSFKEKPQVTKGWINGGFFVANKKFFKFIRGDKEILEKKPLEIVSRKRQLLAFRHKGFWKCMDTPRDKEILDNFLKVKN